MSARRTRKALTAAASNSSALTSSCSIARSASGARSRAGARPVARQREQRHGPGEEALVAAARRFGDRAEPRGGERRVQERRDRGGVDRVGAREHVARIERDRRVAGGKDERARRAAHVRPHDAREVASRAPAVRKSDHQAPPFRASVRWARSRRQCENQCAACTGRRASGRPSRPCVQMRNSAGPSALHGVTCSPRRSGRSNARSMAPLRSPLRTCASPFAPPASETTNAALHPHFTPRSGEPNGELASGMPARVTRSNASRTGGGSASHGLDGIGVEARDGSSATASAVSRACYGARHRCRGDGAAILAASARPGAMDRPRRRRSAGNPSNPRARAPS